MQPEATDCYIDGAQFSTLFIVDDGRLKLKPFTKQEKEINSSLKEVEKNLSEYLLNDLIAKWKIIKPIHKGLSEGEKLEVLVCEFCFRSPLNGENDVSFTSIIASKKYKFFEAYRTSLKKFAKEQRKIGLLMNEEYNFKEIMAEPKQTQNGNASFKNKSEEGVFSDLSYFAQMEDSTFDRTDEPVKLIVAELQKQIHPRDSHEHFIFFRFPLRLGRIMDNGEYHPKGFQIGLGVFIFRSNISIDNMSEEKKEKIAKSLRDPLLLEIGNISPVLFQKYFSEIALTKIRSNITHRLPATLDSMILELEIQREKLPYKYRELFRVPLQFYVLKMVSSIQRGLVPRWQRYEKLCLQNGKYLLNYEIIKQLWKEISVPVGLSRVRLSPQKIFRQYWSDVQEPKLLCNKENEIPFKNSNEVSALLSLCVPLLIEAFQHAFMSSILEYGTTRANKQAKVEVELEKNEVVIKNPAHNKRNLLDSFSKKEGQKREIKKIERLINFAWTVEFPEPESYSDLWIVRIKRKKENANE